MKNKQNRDKDGRFAKKEFKCLGKIDFVEFGLNDDSDKLGLCLGFTSKDFSGTDDGRFFMCIWLRDFGDPPKDKLLRVHFVANEILNLLKSANKHNIRSLIGVPVEITYTDEGVKRFKDFRVLTEVL